MLWLLLACAPKGLPIRLDPEVSVHIVGREDGERAPYTLDIPVRSRGAFEHVELRVDGAKIGEVTDAPFHWRAPRAGPIQLEARAVREGVVVGLDTVRLEVGVGLSDAVARWMDTYPSDGSLGFHWPPDDGVWWGTTRDLWYQGALLSPGDPERRSHCVGLTWEVAMSVLEEQVGGPDNAINGLSVADLAELRADWFVREVRGAGAAEAVVRFGVGERVPFADLRRGDFLQMWTVGGAGHSGIFHEWVKDGEAIIGVRYWSTHPALNGIGYWADSFGGYGLDKAHFYAARLLQKADWVPAKSE
ncbi:MAG: hypothetical protein Q8P41_09665 [Pseudomonadota bacterium]|nr:hypothetical protein [Pseudomonadota bacterium]